MNRRFRCGKFGNSLQAGAAGLNQFPAVGDNQNFSDFFAAAGNHCGNGAGFGTGAAGVRNVFNITAAADVAAIV